MFSITPSYDVQLANATLAERRGEADRQRLLALSPPSSGRMGRFAGALGRLFVRRVPAPHTAGRPNPTAPVCCPGSAL